MAGTYLGRLQVESNGASTVFLKDASTNGANLVMQDTSNTGRVVLGNGTNFYVGVITGTFNGSNLTTPLFRVYGNGNVGIGTSATPTTGAKLEVSGNIKLSSAGWIGATGNQISFDNSTNYYNVAIGTGATTAAKLEVNGNIRLTTGGWIAAAGTS